MPTTPLIRAITSDAPKLSLSAATDWGLVTTSQNPVDPSFVDSQMTAAIGSTTTNVRKPTTNARDRVVTLSLRITTRPLPGGRDFDARHFYDGSCVRRAIPFQRPLSGSNHLRFAAVQPPMYLSSILKTPGRRGYCFSNSL